MSGPTVPVRDFLIFVGPNAGASPSHGSSCCAMVASAALMSEVFGRTVEKRRPLTNDESLFLGNPGSKPVRIGDVVVPTQYLGQYIKWRATAAATSTSTT